MWQTPAPSLPQGENRGGCVGASLCAKAAPDLHADEQPLRSNATLACDAEIELNRGSWPRSRWLGPALWHDGGKGLGGGWMLHGKLGMAADDGKVPGCGVT